MRNTNIEDAAARSQAWKQPASADHAKKSEAQRARRDATQKAKQAKKLGSSKAAKEGVSLEALAARDAQIVAGTSRGKHAMKK